MATSIPPVWASNTNFATGPDAGQPCKVDPGAALSAEGFEPAPVVAAHINFVLNAMSKAERRMYGLALCQLYALGRNVSGLSSDIAVTSLGSVLGGAVLGVVNASGSILVMGGASKLIGSLASITTAPTAAAYDPVGNKLIVVGNGGSNCCIASSPAFTFAAGGVLGGAAVNIIWNAVKSRFLALYAGNVSFSTNGAAWTNVAVAGAGTNAVPGMAQLANGNVVVLTAASGPPTMSLSSNGGTSWASTGAPAGNFNSGCSVAGAGFSEIYFAGVELGTNILRVFASSDGNVWTLRYSATVGYNGGTIAAGLGHIQQCPDTGALFLSVQAGNITTLQASLDSGATWTDPLPVTNIGFNTGATHRGWGVANGRVFAAGSDGVIYATDGLDIYS